MAPLPTSHSQALLTVPTTTPFPNFDILLSSASSYNGSTVPKKAGQITQHRCGTTAQYKQRERERGGEALKV